MSRVQSRGKLSSLPSKALVHALAFLFVAAIGLFAGACNKEEDPMTELPTSFEGPGDPTDTMATDTTMTDWTWTATDTTGTSATDTGIVPPRDPLPPPIVPPVDPIPPTTNPPGGPGKDPGSF